MLGENQQIHMGGNLKVTGVRTQFHMNLGNNVEEGRRKTSLAFPLLETNGGLPDDLPKYLQRLLSSCSRYVFTVPGVRRLLTLHYKITRSCLFSGLLCLHEDPLSIGKGEVDAFPLKEIILILPLQSPRRSPPILFKNSTLFGQNSNDILLSFYSLCITWWEFVQFIGLTNNFLFIIPSDIYSLWEVIHYLHFTDKETEEVTLVNLLWGSWDMNPGLWCQTSHLFQSLRMYY